MSGPRSQVPQPHASRSARDGRGESASVRESSPGRKSRVILVIGSLGVALAAWLGVRALFGDGEAVAGSEGPAYVVLDVPSPPPRVGATARSRLAPTGAAPFPAPSPSAADPAGGAAAPPSDGGPPTHEEPAYTIDVTGEHPGMKLFPPAGTKPIQRGILVPDDFELPPGYVRHHQATDDGQRVPAILKFHPDYDWLDSEGHPISLPADRVVPPELAPPGLPIRMLEPPPVRSDQVAP